MSHLKPERLAALADDEPTAVEAEHLASCASCALERETFGRLLMLSAQERERGADLAEHAPLTRWGALAAELREEGRIRHERPAAFVVASRWWVRAAAAVLLVAGGVWAGRASTGQGGDAEGATRVVRQTGADTQVLAAGNPAALFGSVEEAQLMLARADSVYRLATLYLAEKDTTTRQFRNSDVYRARLAALDAMAGVARQAVGEVPHDPVISQYYMSTLAAREATLRQLDGALPTGARLTGF